MIETLLEKQAQWLSGTGAESDIVVSTQCRLCRNLSDFPYPGKCSEDEKRSIVERIVDHLDTSELMTDGSFVSVEGLDDVEIRFLHERCVVGVAMQGSLGARGAYVSSDQSLSIAVNERDHLTLRGLASGLQPLELWERVSMADDSLASSTDYAFHERLGYLTAQLHEVGTGLTIRAILHLPALEAEGEIEALGAWAESKRHQLKPLYPSGKIALGDFYVLVNVGTLGRSEEETATHIRHLASEVVERERAARQRQMLKVPLQFEDRVERALGVARHARLLAFDEALRVLSSLRLGISIGLLDQYTFRDVNDAFMMTQNAHIEMKCGHLCDEFTLTSERADIFRSRFAPA